MGIIILMTISDDKYADLVARCEVQVLRCGLD